MRFAIILVLFCLAGQTGYPDTLLVPQDYDKIQWAIDAAKSGDMVLVAPGLYPENIDFIGKAVKVISIDGPSATIIDGSQLGSVVTFMSGEGAESWIEGFTVTNGTGRAVPPFHFLAGGGIHCHYGSSPTIRNNIITQNTGALGAGLCCILDSSPEITGNIISENEAQGVSSAGGGIYCVWNSSPVIEYNVIASNEAFEFGGGIECASSSSPMICDNMICDNTVTKYFGGGIDCFDNSFPFIEGNVIRGNSAAKRGGGIFLEIGCDCLIMNNLICENTALKRGGGIEASGSSPDFINNTLFKNSASIAAGALRCSNGSEMKVVNSILWDNTSPLGPEIQVMGESTLHMRHCDVQGGQALADVEAGSMLDWGAGMLDADPLFVEPTVIDCHIYHDSPCRDAGDSAAPGMTPHDFEDDPRIAHGIADIGADEFHTHLYYTGNAAPGGTIKGKLTGLPGTSPVGLIFGAGILDPPLPTPWGAFYLQAPWVLVVLWPVPAGGVIALSAILPISYPAPYDVPMQALIGSELTNPSVIKVR